MATYLKCDEIAAQQKTAPTTGANSSRERTGTKPPTPGTTCREVKISLARAAR